MAEVSEVKGLRELGEALRGLSADMQKKVARQAVAAGAKVVRDAARRYAPKDTGALRRGVVMKRARRSQLTEEYLVTISTKEMKKYVAKSRASIYELDGPIRPGGPKKLLAKKESYESWGDMFYGRFFEFGTVKMPARPFLRPAIENNTQKATEAIAQRLKQRIDKARAK